VQSIGSFLCGVMGPLADDIDGSESAGDSACLAIVENYTPPIRSHSPAYRGWGKVSFDPAPDAPPPMARNPLFSHEVASANDSFRKGIQFNR
jgi:hypothetical protein